MKGPFFPLILSRNWQLKVSALAMAVLLWTVPRFEATRRDTLENIPVRVQVNDPQWATHGDPNPATIDVTLAGPARALFALAADRPVLIIPVDRVASPDTQVILRPGWLRLPDLEGVEVESLRPSSVALSFEPVQIVAVPLAPRYRGTLPEGLARSAPATVEPATVTVLGPSSRLADLDSVSLLPLDLSTVRTSGSFTVPVDTARLGRLDVSPTLAAVQLQVEEMVERTLPELPVTPPARSDGPPFQVRPSVVTVKLVGARSLVEAVDPLSLRVFIPLPRTRLSAFPPGGEERVLVAVEGVPDLVEVILEPEVVLLRRPAGL